MNTLSRSPFTVDDTVHILPTFLRVEEKLRSLERTKTALTFELQQKTERAEEETRQMEEDQQLMTQEYQNKVCRLETQLQPTFVQ